MQRNGGVAVCRQHADFRLQIWACGFINLHIVSGLHIHLISRKSLVQSQGETQIPSERPTYIKKICQIKHASYPCGDPLWIRLHLKLAFYRTILCAQMQPNTAKLEQHVNVQMDNDPKNTARATEEFHNAQKWDILQWLSQSSNLSPTERVL